MEEKVIKHRNPLGQIFIQVVVKNGKKKTAYDARKRYTPPGGGKKKQKFKRCWTYSEASLALVNFKNEIDREFAEYEALGGKPKDHTFSELVAYYKTEYVKPAVFRNNRKVAGFKRSSKVINFHLDVLNEFFGSMNLRKITYEDLRQFKEIYQNTKTKHRDYPAVATVNEKLSTLRRLFNVAIQKNWLDVSPFQRGKSLIDKAAEAKRSRMLTFEEEERLLKACEPHIQTLEYDRIHKNTKEVEKGVEKKFFVDRSHIIPLIVCALDTAMRRGEIFNLEWRQIDLDKKLINLTGEDAEQTKTGIATIFPITDRLHELLLNKYRNQKPGTKVFKKIEFKRSFRSACAEAKINDLQFRDLRAVAITRMMESGTPGDLVRKISRHTSDKVFLSNYTRINVENAQAVGRALDKYIEKEKAKLKNDTA